MTQLLQNLSRQAASTPEAACFLPSSTYHSHFIVVTSTKEVLYTLAFYAMIYIS